MTAAQTDQLSAKGMGQGCGRVGDVIIPCAVQATSPMIVGVKVIDNGIENVRRSVNVAANSAARSATIAANAGMVAINP